MVSWVPSALQLNDEAAMCWLRYWPNRSKLDAVVNVVSIGSLKVTTSVRSYGAGEKTSPSWTDESTTSGATVSVVKVELKSASWAPLTSSPRWPVAGSAEMTTVLSTRLPGTM